MIKVCFPPGGYGTYITRCLYSYTNLRIGEFEPLDFDNTGSSHYHYKNKHRKQIEELIQCLHFDVDPGLFIANTDRRLVMVPSPLHQLDYYNNQYVKYEKRQLISYIDNQLPPEDIKQKLKSGWNYMEPFSETTPAWILREFFSFWITDCFSNGYSVKTYSRIIAEAIIDIQDIFLNFEYTFEYICSMLDLQINIKTDIILDSHKEFLSRQSFHNSQLKCQQWVYDTIKGVRNTASPCQTIFDESYVQYFLRELGYELKCDGLNNFPNNSRDLHNIIYKK